MNILEAATAFAVLMIIFSTITTALSEIVIRVVSLRARILAGAVEELYVTLIWPRMKNSVAVQFADFTNEAVVRENFLDQMLNNPASVTRSSRKGGSFDWLVSKLLAFANTKRVGVLTARAFAERLGRTTIGQALLEEGEENVELVVNEFVRSFDRLSASTREAFRRYAQMAAMIMAIILAFAANIDASRLFTALLEDPELRQSLIQEGDERIQEYQAASERYQAALDDLDRQLSLDNADQAGADDLDIQLSSSIEKSRTAANEARLQAEEALLVVNDLRDRQIPIGPDYYPYCKLLGRDCAGGRPKDDPPAPSDPSGSLQKSLEVIFACIRLSSWFLMVLLSGILIGLGGPFWSKVFIGLSQALQMLRSLGVGSRKPDAEPEKSTAPPPDFQKSYVPKDVVDAFTQSAVVQRQAQPGLSRDILDPLGRTLEFGS